MIKKFSFFLIAVFSISTIAAADELKIKVKPQTQTKAVKIARQKPDEKKTTPAKGPLRLPLKHFK
ncbi:MAG: hypothetical protein ABFD50_02665 [Smithella sp.]